MEHPMSGLKVRPAGSARLALRSWILSARLTTVNAANRTFEILIHPIDERGPALARLRERLMAEGQDPSAFLDGTIDSLVPRWRCSAALEFKEGQVAAGSAAKLGGVPMLAGDV
jgi:hypothetical protein